MSFWELRDYIGQLKAAGSTVRKIWSSLLLEAVLPAGQRRDGLVADPSRPVTAGGRFGIGLAIAIMAGYLVDLRRAGVAPRATCCPPLIAAWSANVIFRASAPRSCCGPART